MDGIRPADGPKLSQKLIKRWLSARLITLVMNLAASDTLFYRGHGPGGGG